MKTSTAYNHYKRLKSKMEDMHRSAISGCMPHVEIVAALKEKIWNDPALAKCPAWVRCQLSERSSAHLDEIHRYWVVWMFETPAGLKSRWEDLTDEEKLPYTKEGKTGSHYWLRLKNRNGYSWFDIDGQKATASYEITDRKF